MELFHKLMNILLPPIAFVALLFLLPPYLVFKVLHCIKRHIFSENVAGKVVVITGAASGIGEQMAYEYAKRGANLVLVDLKPLGSVVERARHLGSRDVVAVSADVSVIQDCKRFVDIAINHFGRLDHLVNNAGVARGRLFKNVHCISDFTPTMDINFWGTVYDTHFAIPHLRKSKGKIIVIASTCGWYPIPRLSFYNASKAAIISFYETLRTEIGWEIGITIVTPGLIRSEMTLDQAFAQGLGFIPTETKEECAKAIVKSACRGDKYLVEPSWVRVLFLFKAVCPEVIEYCNRLAFRVSRSRTSIRNAAGKKNLKGSLTQSIEQKAE
ncbi:11-beta-hydroxysteroid dehydrogenase-like 4A [Pistacia vera]|uniref:11-beta-hydroxysteroid dehydrogenase-like 4A n=1 Tax=Pistacia vera TaxID=55513 RepID=UPI0012636258|nr:11-beta-hydroxysteroid dehydrogenase-like 4A [Pistacia vera]